MRVSINRMQNFLLADELDENAIVREDKPIPNPNGPTPLAIAVDGAAFRWEVAPTESSTTESKAVPADVLTNVSLQIPIGSLTVIVGAVGAGKSSLLQGLIGEIKRTAGSVRVHGTVAYCAQQAWIQSASLRDNILFGSPFDQAKFDSVVEACALTRDLEVLTDGERTEIGEKGINLSGGQKQRVNIARGVYSGADVVLLDDPLSAVDAVCILCLFHLELGLLILICLSFLVQHVAQHLFQRCICDELRQKTRILVTHQLSFVSDPSIDQIIVIKDNTIFEQGTYAQLMSRPEGELCRLVSEFVKSSTTDDNTDAAAADADAVKVDSAKPSDVSSASSVETVTTQALTEKLKRHRSNSVEVVKPAEHSAEPVKAQPPAKAQLVEEKRVTGSVKSDVYWHYLMATNSQSLSLLLILSIVCAQAIQVLITQFMAWWTSDTFHRTTYFYISVYGAMNAGNVLLVVLANIVLTYVAARASRQFHDRALASVLRAPMTFFDTVPLGRVLNRFSGDLSSIDTTVPTQFISFFMALLGIVCMLCNMIAIFYYMIIPLIPLAWLCIYINNFFRHSSIEFQRMSSISKSPVLAHFGEMLSGLPTIRAYHEQAHFIAESNAKMSVNQTMSYTQTLSVLWLSIRLQLVAAFVSGCTAGLSLYFAYKGYEVGLMALVLQYGLSLNSNLGPLFNQFVMLENGMNSVERLKEYSDELPHEAARHSEQCKTADNVTVPLDAQWPKRGSVVFDNIQMRYRPELPLVLDNVSLKVDSGQLVGVVGRTGAGKSSLMSALFRLIELESGRILVDDVDISSVGLAELRQRLAIIPQDPVLYGGTVRSNLDPFGAYSDQDLWASLEAVSLASAVRALDGELGAAVSENGENFSVGQKSQLCLARALLRRAKVLVLDEV
jgi:ABC-type multidrug transport system fused ATPase/permease subunit